MAGEGGHRSTDYELDLAGNRLSVTDKDSKYIKFGLDPKYQLTNETQWSAKVPGTRNLQYAYVMDANGNRLFQHKDGVVTSYTIGDNNEVTNISGIGAIDYDHYGSIVAYSDVSLTYDFERHMTHIEDENAHTDDHEYDGNGRRMRSKLNGAANWTNFIHDELTEQILAEYTLISSTFTIKSVNTYGIGLISTNRESTKRYFHFDGLGSTRALTDGSQVVQDTYEFSAYGIQESSTGSSVNPFRFVGQWGYYDDGARGSTFGLLLLGIRHYKPSWGRFLVWDVIRTTPIYGYCGNRPLVIVDPTGRFNQWFCYGFCAIVCVLSEGSLCWTCIEMCLSTNDIDELRKLMERLRLNLGNCDDPVADGDCFTCPGKKAVGAYRCQKCCARLWEGTDDFKFNRCSCWCSKIHEGSGEDCAPYPKVDAIPKAGRATLGIGG